MKMKIILIIAVCSLLLVFGSTPYAEENRYKTEWKQLSARSITAYKESRLREGSLFAEKAYEYALKYFGLLNANTLTSINNLAFLYQAQGRYEKAEPLYRQAASLRANLLGGNHPDTLSSLNNLALLYQAVGRYGEAEELYKRTLLTRQKKLGKNHRHTLSSANNLAGLYQTTERFDEAEVLYKEVLEIRTKTFGIEDQQTLTSLNNLAGLYYYRGDYDKAEPLLEKSLAQRRKKLGSEHPDTLYSANNLALLYQAQKRYDAAEPLFREYLNAKTEILGENHPHLIHTLNNIGILYSSQQRFPEAEKLYKNILESMTKILGKLHPDILTTWMNYIVMTVNKGKDKSAFRLLQGIEGRLFSRFFQEIYDISPPHIKKLYLDNISNFKNIVCSFAVKYPNPEYAHYAANAILRWKHIAAEKNALKLGFPDNKKHMQASYTDVNNILWHMDSNTAVIEFCEYQSVDFKSGKSDTPSLAAYLLLSDMKIEKRVLFVEIDKIDNLKKIFDNSAKAQKELYAKLFGKFDSHIKTIDKLHIAPDSFINLIPFSGLILPDKRFWAQRQQINRLQTGRDLLLESSKPNRAFIAVGGPEYGEIKKENNENNKESFYPAMRIAKELGGVPYLKFSQTQSSEIAEFYKAHRNDNVTLLFYKDASEYALKSIKTAPEILHLSIRPFYRKDIKLKKSTEGKETFLNSGLMLAGANRGMRGILDKKGNDGILYSREILQLNLNKTRLLVLTACNLKERKDYSQGIYSLIRAFHTAGVQSVILPVQYVTGKKSREFMVKFYEIWLAQKKELTPGQALHETKLYFIEHKNPEYRKAKFWSPYVIISK